MTSGHEPVGHLLLIVGKPAPGRRVSAVQTSSTDAATASFRSNIGAREGQDRSKGLSCEFGHWIFALPRVEVAFAPGFEGLAEIVD
jgi:hypothetical protein